MFQLNKLLSGVTIAQGGVLPNIAPTLLPKKTSGGPVESQAETKPKATKGGQSKNAGGAEGGLSQEV